MPLVIDQAMGEMIRLTPQCVIIDDCTVNVQALSKMTDSGFLRANHVFISMAAM